MKEPRERVLDVLEECLYDLHRQAVGIVADHWDAVMKHERGAKSWEDKSRLQLASHRKGNHIQLKWIGTRWFGTGSSRKSVKVSIKRTGRDLSYTQAALKQWARDWELELVMDTESKLAPIRRQAAHYVKAITSSKAANAIAMKVDLPEEDVEDTDD